MKFQLKRLYSQILFFLIANLGALQIKSGFCYPFFYCHACPTASAACPLRALEISVFDGKINWKLLLFPLVIIGMVGIISGRAVCGWACPIGLLQRGTSRIARKFKHKSPLPKEINDKLHGNLRYAKYVALIGLVLVSPFLIGFMFTDICPVGVLTGTLPILALNPGGFTPSFYFYPALGIFLLFLVLIFTVERGWCRYFCPIGALLAPFNKISLYHVEVNKDACKHCNICSEVCPMGIDIPNMHRDPECILCGKCVSTCPHSVIQYRRN